MITELKSLFFHLQNKRRHAGLKIGFGSRAIDSEFTGEDIEIGRDCYLLNSKFAKGVIVKDGCTIFRSNFENHTAVYPKCAVANSSLGAYSYLAENSSMGGVTVGRFSSIGPHFICGYGAHPTNLVTTSPVFYSTRKQCGVSFTDADLYVEQRQTTIENDVWIGTRAFVREGVRIGNGAIIAAGAVVVADVPDYAMMGGVPAKLIRYRFPEEAIRELLEIEWWNWPEEQLRAAQPLLSQPDVNSFLAWARRG